jgi:ABC-type oligopeptide transport system substrate-binding subunit
LERRRLSLKKPLIVTGLVLTLMLAAFVAVAVPSHAAPVATKSGINSRAAHIALEAAKKNQKSSTCSTSSKFYVNPCTVKETTSGQVVVTLIGQKLNPNSTYTLHAETLDTACASAISSTNEPTDLSGGFNDSFVLAGPCTYGTFYIQLQNDFSPFNVYTTKLVIKHP